MRFIGNKEIIVPHIRALLSEQGLMDKGLTLFDAFCGTGAVSDALKDSFHVVINDLLEWCVTYTRGRLAAPNCDFKKLGFDPFQHFRLDQGSTKGFFHQNYSLGGSSRMYFIEENAARIDYIRLKIEQWRDASLVDDDEYAYLIASLIEAISAVSNTAGVYGAFLKHWDSRAKRKLTLEPVGASSAKHLGFETRNSRTEEIISDVDCDVLYLDPPYTQNQYGTQYHLLETLVKNDAPSLSAITGSRPTAPMRSDWSVDIKKQILFDRVLAGTKAKYVVVSYSPDGFMSKSYIEAVLKRYGDPASLISRALPYRKYTNFKSQDDGDHLEYLFFIKLRPKAEVQYVSPLNYIGSKTRMIPFLKSHFPKNMGTFVDAFGGGFNVGINSNASKIVYNEYNHLVGELIQSFSAEDTFKFVQYVRRQISKFRLEKENVDRYSEARDYYNSLPVEKRDPRLLYAIILYGFNQQIRFNSRLEFNNPVGQRWFNERILEKLISFSRVIKEKNIVFKTGDFRDLAADLDEHTFVYMDPPYRLTTGAYNDGKRGFKGWGIADEKDLFEFAEYLNSRSVSFMLSYVLQHRGKHNGELASWVSRNGFRIVECTQIQGVGREEVIILNYD